MESFDTFFSLKLAFLIFSAAEQFSTNLQAKDTTVAEGSRGAVLLRAHYTLHCGLRQLLIPFTRVFSDSASDLTDEPALPRYRKTPRRFDTGAQPHRYSSPEDRYRHAYLEALDHACGEIQRRFDQSDLTVVSEVETLLLDSANGTEIPGIPEVVAEFFHGKIDLVRLKIQLLMLPAAIGKGHAQRSRQAAPSVLYLPCHKCHC